MRQQLNLAFKPCIPVAVQSKAWHSMRPWKIILPMIAVMTFAGCTNNAPTADKNERKDSDRMGEVVTQKGANIQLYLLEEVRGRIGARCTPELASTILSKSGCDPKKMEKLIENTKKVFSEVKHRFGKRVFNSIGAALKNGYCCELLIDDSEMFLKCVEVYRVRMRIFIEHYEWSKKNGKNFSKEIETALSFKFGKIAPHPEAMWMFGQEDVLALGNFNGAIKQALLSAIEESSRRTGLAPEFISACFLSEGGVLIYSKEAGWYPYNSVNTYLSGLDTFHDLWARKKVQKWLPKDFGSRFKPMDFMTYNNKQMVRGCDFGQAEDPRNYENLVLAFGAELKYFEIKVKHHLPGLSGEDLQVMTYLAFNFGETALQRYVNEHGVKWVKERCLRGSGGFANVAQVMSIKNYLVDTASFATTDVAVNALFPRK